MKAARLRGIERRLRHRLDQDIGSMDADEIERLATAGLLAGREHLVDPDVWDTIMEKYTGIADYAARLAALTPEQWEHLVALLDRGWERQNDAWAFLRSFPQGGGVTVSPPPPPGGLEPV